MNYLQAVQVFSRIPEANAANSLNYLVDQAKHEAP